MKTASQAVLGWMPSQPAAWNARRLLPHLLRDYFKAGRKLDAKSTARQMHRFRLKTKQLRYTLEAFVPLYGAELETRMGRVRPIQNSLGDLNDCQVLLDGMGKKLPRAVRAHMKKRAKGKREDFLRYWKDHFDAADEQKKWEQYLGDPRSLHIEK